MEQQPYVPALGFDWLTRFYDPVLRATVREETFKRRLIEQARIQAAHDVLDLGCGTATLTIMVKQTCPAARVVGLDGDPKVLAIAREKVTRLASRSSCERGWRSRRRSRPPRSTGSCRASCCITSRASTSAPRSPVSASCFARAASCTSRIGGVRRTCSCGSRRGTACRTQSSAGPSRGPR
ncbi:MAG: methyltransferase domain-containing protein [Deltaproteobacteria bacterium]|nr:MAG: methyltransferase domain-containing protein [Deltaproteobacteria bacterium]